MTRRRVRIRIQEPELLAGFPADGALSRLLADASAPAQPEELAGLSAALAAFTAIRPRRSPVKSVIAKLLAAKALAATAGAVSIGGVALAAATGSLPPTAQNFAHNTVGAPAASSHDPSVTPSDTPSDTPSGTPSVTPTGSPSPHATPSPSLVGLCHAYGAGVATAPGKALSNPAFTVLITAAGGKANVPTYCATLLATAPSGTPSAQPTESESSSSHPTGPPSSHPTGAPSSHPTGAPSSHPTGRP